MSSHNLFVDMCSNCYKIRYGDLLQYNRQLADIQQIDIVFLDDFIGSINKSSQTYSSDFYEVVRFHRHNPTDPTKQTSFALFNVENYSSYVSPRRIASITDHTLRWLSREDRVAEDVLYLRLSKVGSDSALLRDPMLVVLGNDTDKHTHSVRVDREKRSIITPVCSDEASSLTENICCLKNVSVSSMIQSDAYNLIKTPDDLQIGVCTGQCGEY